MVSFLLRKWIPDLGAKAIRASAQLFPYYKETLSINSFELFFGEFID